MRSKRKNDIKGKIRSKLKLDQRNRLTSAEMR